MKSKKIFLLFAASIFAAVAIYNIHLAQTQNLGDISLADIAVMAQADGESEKPDNCRSLKQYKCYELAFEWNCLYMVEVAPFNCDDDDITPET